MVAATASRLSVRRSSPLPIATIAIWVVLGLFAVVILLPIAYMVSQAFTPEQDTLVWPIRYIPERPTIDNFRRVFDDPTLPVFRWFINSMVVSSAVTTLVLLLSSLSAYAFARLEFPGRDVIFFILLTSLMVPGA